MIQLVSIVKILKISAVVINYQENQDGKMVNVLDAINLVIHAFAKEKKVKVDGRTEIVRDVGNLVIHAFAKEKKEKVDG